VGTEIRDVFVEHEEAGRIAVILAEKGRRVQNPADGALSFVFYNGTRYEGNPGSRDFRIVDFAEHGIPVRRDDEAAAEVAVQTKPTADLIGSADPHDQAELQARISAPLSLIVLMMLAVPLSRSRPREGRYARLGVGMLIYITYANTLAIARFWVERGELSPSIGLWPVHGSLAAIGLILLAREAGVFARARPLEVAR
jgi:lipopolysaccharide export system permease protein